MSFLRDYLKHAEGNECPYMFHVWCAYGCLSAAVGRRVFMHLDDAAIYTNLYTLLVGNAGNGKTHSLNKLRKFLYALDLPVSGDVETPQGMWRFMTGDTTPKPGDKTMKPYGGKPHKLFLPWADAAVRDVHPMNIIASEFIDFINMDDKAWINALNNIYDTDLYHYRTKGQGEDYVQGPYITLIGGLTTQVASGMQKDQIINTGFGRRTIFQYGERDLANPCPRPIMSEDQKLAYIRALEHLKKVMTVQGKFEWTEETGTWWDKWYRGNSAAVLQRPQAVQSWYLTKPTQLMKLAMLTSLSERFDRVFEVSHFETALAYLTEMEKDLYKIFGGVGRNELAEVAIKIFNWVSQLSEPVASKVLLARFWRDLPNRRSSQQEFKECIDSLLANGQLSCWVATGGTASDAILATPEVLQAFVARNVGVTVPLPPSAPPV